MERTRAFTGDTHTPGVPIHFDDNMPRNPRKALVDFRNYLLGMATDSAGKIQFLLTRCAEYLSRHIVMNNNFRFFFADSQALDDGRNSTPYFPPISMTRGPAIEQVGIRGDSDPRQVQAIRIPATRHGRFNAIGHLGMVLTGVNQQRELQVGHGKNPLRV